MVLAEVFLGAFLQVLFDRLTSLQSYEFPFHTNTKKKIIKWRKTLTTIQAVLTDAEEKQTTSRTIKLWLQDLRDLSYDIEDIVDKFSTEALQRNHIAYEQDTPPTTKMINKLASHFADLTFSMRPKIKEITTRLTEISEHISQLGLLEKLHTQGGGGNGSTHVKQRSASTCLPNGPHIVGRDEDKKNVLEILLKNVPTTTNGNDDINFCVVPILGMGGLGKTTFVRILYNDKDLIHRFDVQAWVCVSDEFDVMRVTKAILESITCKSCDLKELNQVQLILHHELKDKRFLIVLDDVWNKNYGSWDALRTPLMAGAHGSQILVTTRDRDVALMMGTDGFYYDLQLISDDDVWSVFLQHTFDSKETGELQRLETKYREKVVEKCEGLPLAARTLGGLLRSKREDYEWEDVLNSRLWDLSDEECDILPILRLSYYHLPSHLKTCFAFCAILPKNLEFEKEKLVLLWMASGLIRSTNKDEELEEIGYEYLDDLLSRSMLQESESESESESCMFEMHNLFNDLAQWAAGETCFRVEDETRAHTTTPRDISQKTRHASFVPKQLDGYERFKVFSAAKQLRTFLSISDNDSPCGFLTNKVPEMLSELRCLRILSLSGYHINHIPNFIHELKLLRYLDFSRTRIQSLPESICSLYNLETLLLKDCNRLRSLPTKIGKLINLRCLDIRNANMIKQMPLGIHKLTKLTLLSDFVVEKHKGSKITALKSLKLLKGSLRVSKLENVVDVRDAKEARLNEKELDELILEWSSEFDSSRNEHEERDVLDMLQPHGDVEQVTVIGYAGSKLSTWIEDPRFSILTVLTLENCKKCVSLPQLGQLPLLQELSIVGMHAVKSIGPEFHGESSNQTKPFPSLEVLKFEDMKEWETWVTYQHGFPRLQELTIARCPALSGQLPIRLPSLQQLVITQSHQFVASITSFPALCDVKIEGCKDVLNENSVSLDSLTYVEVSNVSNMKHITEELAQGMTKVETLSVSGCKEMTSLWQNRNAVQLTSLRSLVIQSCPKLVSLMDEELEDDDLQQSQLQSVMINDCESLETLPRWLCSVKSLRWLQLEDCPNLVVSFLSLPSLLKVVWIKNCNFIPKTISLQTSTCLQTLFIDGCASLTSFSRQDLPSSLKALNIISCNNLKYFLDDDSQKNEESFVYNKSGSSLVMLLIRNCEALVCLTSKGSELLLPATLKELHVYSCPNLVTLTTESVNLPLELQDIMIDECPKLESIVTRFQENMSVGSIEIQKCEKLKHLPDGIHNLSYLHEITISDCSALLSFPKQGLPNANLKKLFIHNCHNLKDLPPYIDTLTSLEVLEISNCPCIVSFPKEGLPTNLTSLSFTNLGICKPLLEWGLYRLTSLEQLNLVGGCEDMTSFPDEDNGMALPVSLIGLSIGSFPNLKRLSSEIFQSLVLLTFLAINGCPKLKSFPKKGLPSSLLKLHINDCGLLKERCDKDKGPEWFKIADIPSVFMDNTSVFDSGLKCQFFGVKVIVETMGYGSH